MIVFDVLLHAGWGYKVPTEFATNCSWLYSSMGFFAVHLQLVVIGKPSITITALKAVGVAVNVSQMVSQIFRADEFVTTIRTIEFTVLVGC